MRLKQFLVTVAAGKRLIAKGMAAHPAIKSVLSRGTLVIVAGTTNGYVAQEILAATGQGEGFTTGGFRRGTTAPPGVPLPKADLRGDVILVDGVWQKGKEIFDVADDLKAGDVVLKGGNALDLRRRQAAVYIGHPKAGTAGAAFPAVVGRRVIFIAPIGVEKRVVDDLHELAAEVNAPTAGGPGLMLLPGLAFTELDAIELLTGAKARLVAAGGVAGAEGCAWFAVKGDDQQLEAAEKLIQSVAKEPAWKP